MKERFPGAGISDSVLIRKLRSESYREGQSIVYSALFQKRDR